ncbi:hypothetical protein C8R46DRAFT_1226260 [Mycena filopes]|nr:hypothetical protein C8R46DRAFT_1226260 [Mycena filopes]
MKRKQSEPAADAPASPPPKRPVGRPRKDTTKPPPKKKAAPKAKLAPASTRATRNTAPTPSTSSAIAIAFSSESETIPNPIEIDSDSDLTSLDHETLDGAEFDAATIGMLGRGDKGSGGKKAGGDDEEGSDSKDGEDDDEQEEDEEDEQYTDLDLELIIPVSSNATDTLTISSTSTYLEFTQSIADEMNVRRKDLEIGFKLSHWTKDTKPRILSNPMHLLRLFNSAREELAARAKSKARAKKPLQVTIVDLKVQEKPDSKKGTSSKKPKSKTPKLASASDDEEAEVPTKKKTGAQFLRELEATHKCEKHSGFCLVAKNGEHVSLSNPNLSLWSMLCAQGVHDSVTSPPTLLNLPMENGTQAASTSRRQTMQNPSAPPPGPHPYSYYAPTGPYPPPYYPPPPAAPPAPIAAPKSPAKTADDSDDNESPTLFPKLDDWLLELDTSGRGEDGHGFSKFGAPLRAQGFSRVVQLTDLGADGEKTLQEICVRMTLGVAKLLLKYARQDCKKIHRIESERKAEWAAR